MPLAGVVGRNARRIRGSSTADAVAKAVRLNGLNWGTGRISELEHGRVSPTVPTLVVLANALSSVSGRPVALTDLATHDGPIALTDSLTIDPAELQQFLSGQPVGRLTASDAAVAEAITAARSAGLDPAKATAVIVRTKRLLELAPASALSRVLRESGEAESRVAKSLGVPGGEVAAASAYLWGTPLSVERDRRAGSSANAQDRGRITRELKAEIKKVLDGND